MADDYKPVLRAGSDPLVFFKYPGSDEGGSVAKGHVMATAMAHALRDGEVVFMGANSLIPLAGARLAQLTHAPNLTILAGASGGVNTLVEPLAPSSGDYANLVAEAVLEFDEVLALLTGGRGDVFFAGGIQIDRRGNCNLVAAGPLSRPTFRGPGSAALPSAQLSRRKILYSTSHDRRVFVPRVDFVSLPGWPDQVRNSEFGIRIEDGRDGRVHESPSTGETRTGIPHSALRTPHSPGPDLVVTPLAVLDFTGEGEMRLKSLHPEVTLDMVQESTGFELEFPDGELPVTPSPTPHELRLLRQLDPDGLLTVAV
jgi:glutaconate CoA-transferase, subunit B